MKTHILTEDVERLYYLLDKIKYFVESKAMTVIAINTIFNDQTDQWVTVIMYND